jgi:signal transduction histidine kinase/ligand-binding sensor domain-containing protein
MWRILRNASPLLLVLILRSQITAVTQYRVDTWSTQDGLPQRSVFSIIQTRDGYLWLSTFDGLVRFDGVRFTVFDKSNTEGLTTNRFTALYEDKDGTLWAGTGDGSLTRYRDGAFTTYTSAESSSEVMGFDRDLNGEVLVRMRDKQFYLRNGDLVIAPIEYQARDTKLYLAPSGTKWTISKTQTTESNGGRITHYPLKLRLDSWLLPFEDSQKNLWLGHPAGLYRLRDGQITRYTEQSGLPPRMQFRPICEDDEGGVWFATGSINGSIGLVRFKDGHFNTYGENSGLKGQTINCVFKDREGTIWAGSSLGLHRVTKQIINGYSTAEGLRQLEVYPILQVRNGDIWIGSSSGLSSYKGGRFKAARLPEPYKVVEALAEDRSAGLWIGVAGGLLLLDKGKLKNLSTLVGNTPVSTILTDRNGRVWVGSANGLFEFEGERVAGHFTTRDGLPADDVTAIHEDRQGQLWIATPGSLTQLKDGEFVSYRLSESKTANHVRSIYEDTDGTFWIGTYDDGLFRFRMGNFFNYRMEHGLFNNGVFQILEDRHGYFWISCNRGIYRVSRRELNDFADGKISRINSVAYGMQDGMLSIECNGGRSPAGFIARDGKFWFPTQEGIAVVDPEAAVVNSRPPPVLIESATLEREPVNFRAGVTIQPGQRDLEIAYTGLSYIKPEQIRFKYRLEGLRNEWIDAGPRRTAYFPYLPPGNYTFRVIAANSDGVWNEVGARIRVTVLAPFWLRWWFWLLCLVAAIGIAVFISRNHINRLQRKHAEREAFARQLIESQEHERKRLAGELHDSLSQNLLIAKNWALIGLNTVDGANPAREHLNEISETVSLAIDEVREIAHNLRPYQLERLGLTKTIEQMIAHLRNSADVEFIAELDNIDDLLSPDSAINLYRTVQECVNNVIKHSNAAKAWVFVKRTENSAEITCRDNGRGFDPAASSSRNGLGLTGMAERVRMIGGRYTLESGLGKGTTIRVVFTRREAQKSHE